MRNYIFLFLLCVLPVKSAYACISEILEPAQSLKNLLAVENKESLSHEERSIISAYERDAEYYGHLSAERCWIIGLSEEQKEIRENMRQLILKKWAFEPDYVQSEKQKKSGK